MKNLLIQELDGDLCSTIVEGYNLNNHQSQQRQSPKLNTNNDDPFNFLNLWPGHLDTENLRLRAQQVEESLKLLTSGNQQVLIYDYNRKCKERSTQIGDKLCSINEQIQIKRTSEAKNIPKNFGKQIIKHVKKNKCLIQKILIQVNSKLTYEELNTELQKRKKKMGKIGDLRQLWSSQTNIGRQMRIISNHFIRKQGLHWIFNSKITDYACHIKYRRFFREAIQKPKQLKDLKIVE